MIAGIDFTNPPDFQVCPNLQAFLLVMRSCTKSCTESCTTSVQDFDVLFSYIETTIDEEWN